MINNTSFNLTNLDFKKYMLFLAVSFLGSLYLSLMSQFAIMLYPIPITLQTFGVVSLGLLVGPYVAVSSVVMYLMEGAMGLPVFSAGRGGLWMLFGPTGGFLLAFIAYAFLYGHIKLKLDNNKFLNAITLIIFAEVVLFAVGLLWLGLFIGYNYNLIVVGFYPFIIANLIKNLTGIIGYKLFNKNL